MGQKLILNQEEDRLSGETGTETNRDKPYIIAIVGNTGVGKSLLVSKYLEVDYFEGIRQVPIGRKKVSYKNKNKTYNITIEVWDEVQKSFSRNHIDGIVLLYDIADHSSFDSIPDWFHEKTRVAPDAHAVLVGNKLDLHNSRVVPIGEARSTAVKHGAKYYEISAKTKENINSPFSSLSHLLACEQYGDRLNISSSDDKSAEDSKDVVELSVNFIRIQSPSVPKLLLQPILKNFRERSINLTAASLYFTESEKISANVDLNVLCFSVVDPKVGEELNKILDEEYLDIVLCAMDVDHQDIKLIAQSVKQPTSFGSFDEIPEEIFQKIIRLSCDIDPITLRNLRSTSKSFLHLCINYFAPNWIRSHHILSDENKRDIFTSFDQAKQVRKDIILDQKGWKLKVQWQLKALKEQKRRDKKAARKRDKEWFWKTVSKKERKSKKQYYWDKLSFSYDDIDEKYRQRKEVLKKLEVQIGQGKEIKETQRMARVFWVDYKGMDDLWLSVLQMIEIKRSNL